MLTLGQKIRTARKAKGLTQADVADYFGIKSGSVSLWESDDTRPDVMKLEPLARLLDVSMAELLGDAGAKAPPLPLRDAPQKPLMQRSAPEFSEPFAVPPIPARRVPVFGLAVGGEDGRFEMNGQLLDTVFCPPGFEDAPNLYAVYVTGESMEPVFSPGQTVWVHPNRAPRRGDDVIIQIRPDHEDAAPHGFIKRYQSGTPTKIVVKQFNPPQEITFDRDAVLSIHKIIMVQK